MQRTQERTGQSVDEILNQLELPSATYYRWKARERTDRLADEIVVPRRPVLPPTPQEIQAVRDFAAAHPTTGYKRLTWWMVDEDIAYLRAYQVYEILQAYDLLCYQKASQSAPLKRPAPPDHPDEVWHIDLMYVHIPPRWYYLVDILDGYSRFLVHWSLNLTMLADTVTLTAQEALERLSHRRPGEPKVVHDRGSQFLSAEWHAFIEAAGVTDIKTRVAHPQSNGKLERLHRTHREEGLTEEALSDYYCALDAMTEWEHFYNYERPHSALHCLRPADYYQGDPEACLAQREQKLAQAVEARKAYWADVSEC